MALRLNAPRSHTKGSKYPIGVDGIENTQYISSLLEQLVT